jgi:hypothetical protein
VSVDPKSLDNLRDIITPDGVAWWPPEPGWFVVAALAAVCIVSGIHAWQHARRATGYRRAALRELGAIEAAVASGGEAAFSALVRVPNLLKRVALASHPRREVAGLTGEPWLRILQQTGGRTEFPVEPFASLTGLAYTGKEPAPDDARALLAAVRRWISAQGAAS